MEFARYHPANGHPDWEACDRQARELAERILPVILKDSDLTPADRLADAWRKAKALKQAGENLIVNRRRYRRGDHALRPLYVIWTMLNDCNFRCTYCDNHQGEHYYDHKDPDRLDTARGKDLLRRMITGTSAIYWCGGEPTLRPDLPELLDYAWHLGYFPNMINTNGSLLHKLLVKPAYRSFLRQMDLVIVSLDGLQLEGLRKLWRVKQVEQVFVNLLLLRRLRREVPFKLAVNTVITRDNIPEARAILDLCADLDLWFVPVPVNYRHEPNRELLDDPAYRDLAEQIVARKWAGQPIIGSPTLLERLLFARPYQCLTTLKPHVWSNGHLAFPCRATANVPPADINLLDYAGFDEAYAAARKEVNPNFFHGPGKNQCGGHCAWMQNYTTARYLDGIINPLGSGFVGELLEFAFHGGRG